MTKSINLMDYMPFGDTLIGLAFEVVDTSNLLVRCLYQEVETRYGSEEHAKNIFAVLIEIQRMHDEGLDMSKRCCSEYPGEISSRMRLSPVLEKDGQKVQTLIVQVLIPVHDVVQVFTMKPYCLILSEDLKTWKEIGQLVERQCDSSAKTEESNYRQSQYQTVKTVLKTSPPVPK